MSSYNNTKFNSSNRIINAKAKLCSKAQLIDLENSIKIKLESDSKTRLATQIDKLINLLRVISMRQSIG